MEKEHNLLESDVVTLTLDDDEEIECAIITTFNMDSNEYIALLPLDEDGGNEDGDVWIYRFIRDTTGGTDHDLQNIEDDDEYDVRSEFEYNQSRLNELKEENKKLESTIKEKRHKLLVSKISIERLEKETYLLDKQINPLRPH